MRYIIFRTVQKRNRKILRICIFLLIIIILISKKEGLKVTHVYNTEKETKEKLKRNESVSVQQP